jgi:hypothetical protein
VLSVVVSAAHASPGFFRPRLSDLRRVRQRYARLNQSTTKSSSALIEHASLCSRNYVD